MDTSETVMKAKMAVIEAALGICSLPEADLLRRLEDLWFQGFKAGTESLDPIIKSLSTEMTKIVYAHITGNEELLKSTLDDFTKHHVKVIVASNAESPCVKH